MVVVAVVAQHPEAEWRLTSDGCSVGKQGKRNNAPGLMYGVPVLYPIESLLKVKNEERLSSVGGQKDGLKKMRFNERQ